MSLVFLCATLACDWLQQAAASISDRSKKSPVGLLGFTKPQSCIRSVQNCTEGRPESVSQLLRCLPHRQLRVQTAITTLRALQITEASCVSRHDRHETTFPRHSAWYDMTKGTSRHCEVLVCIAANLSRTLEMPAVRIIDTTCSNPHPKHPAPALLGIPGASLCGGHTGSQGFIKRSFRQGAK